jgi:5S rRNA maturation endonuclease (ribonuclease M5)
LTDNAKELSRLADESGCRIVILTDMDYAGRVMSNLVSNIPRIGITLQTLKQLGLELNPDILEELPQPSNISYTNY